MTWLPRLIFCLISLLISHISFAQDNATPITSVETKERAGKFYFNTNFFSLSNPSTAAISGYSICPRYSHYLSKKFSMGGGLCQGVSSQGSFLFTQITLLGSYSILGGNQGSHKKAEVNGLPLVEEKTFSQAELILSFGVDQIFLAGSDNTIPISGPTLKLDYHFSSTKDYHFAFNTSYSALANGNDSYSLTQFGFSIIF